MAGRLLTLAAVAVAAVAAVSAWLLQTPAAQDWLQQHRGDHLQQLSTFISAAAAAQLAAKAANFTLYSSTNSISSTSTSSSGGDASSRPIGTRLLTAEQLQQYQGAGGSPMYLAILGDIFDVSSKPEFYGGDGGYKNMTGRDATRSFHTGDFEGDLTDDVSDFGPEPCAGLVRWRGFYFQTYPHIGKLVGGAFYDAQGRPTPALQQVEAKGEEGRRIAAEREAEEHKFPACNSKWTATEGGLVWCEGGMHPRYTFYKQEGEEELFKCGCFEDIGWSDYRQLYSECEPEASSCKIIDKA